MLHGKQEFNDYVSTIKQQKNHDIYSVVNTTLIANPYNTDFPEKFIFNRHQKENKFKLFVFNTIKFYIYSFVRFMSFIQVFFYYQILYRKPKYKAINNDLGIDVFLLINKIIKENKFHERYFSSLYEILNDRKIDFVFLPRLYGVSPNPFKAHQQLKSFFKIINKDANRFLFEFELLTFRNFFSLVWMLACYPIKVLRLLIKEQSLKDKIFNKNLLQDISNQSVDAFSRYIFGKNIGKLKNINKIYSWSEFQVIERSFNYGIRKKSDIRIIACQFFVNYPTYFNTEVHNVDEILEYAPHQVLVNGKEGLVNNNIDYQVGVSLRYNQIFKYCREYDGDQTIILGSYFVNKTKSVLRLTENLGDAFFKSHPVIDSSTFKDSIPKNIQIISEDIYSLFSKAAVIIGTESGSLLEAVVCGVSVIVVAQEDELTANPLVDFGKGKIWDIVSSEEELRIKYKKLLEFRKGNQVEIDMIADWYKKNFFVEPTEKNIVEVFELG